MKKLFFPLLIIIILISCKPTKTIVDTSCPGYRKTDFKREDISVHGIGIMPVLGGEEKEQYRRPMGEAITKYFRIEFNEDKVKSPDQVIYLLNEFNLVDEYTTALNNYRIAGIVPKDMVINLGGVLSVDYLLYTRLLGESELTDIYMGEYKFEIRIDEIYVQCQIWDTKIGDVVWEGKGGIAKLDVAEADIINKTAEGLSKVIGNESNDGPCENKKIINDSIDKALMNTYLTIIGISTALLLLLLAI